MRAAGFKRRWFAQDQKKTPNAGEIVPKLLSYVYAENVLKSNFSANMCTFTEVRLKFFRWPNEVVLWALSPDT